jgi:cytochrome P450
MTRAEAAALLGVPPETTGQEAQRAFLRAARFVHPDVLPQAGEDERRAAAARFDALVQARTALLEPPFAPADGPTRPSVRRVHIVPRQDRGLANSLVLIALLSFLIVALVTLDSALRSGSAAGSADGAPIVSSPTP